MSITTSQKEKLPKWAQQHIYYLERRVRELSADIDRLSAPAIKSVPGVSYPVGAFIQNIGGEFGTRPLGADEVVGVYQLSKHPSLRPDDVYFVTLRRERADSDKVYLMSDEPLAIELESSNCFTIRPKRY